MKYFFDSSAIVKRYITEIGSAWVKTVVKNQPKKNLYLSFVTGAEATAAFAKIQGRGNPIGVKLRVRS